MLTADQFDDLTAPLLELYERYQQSVLNDIARRLAKAGRVTATSAWQAQRMIESGALYENVLERLAVLSGQSEAELRRMFSEAGVKALRFDDTIYKQAGLNPIPLNLSPAMLEVLRTGMARTNAIVRNLTMTTALEAQNAFIEAADMAYMQVVHGAMDYNSAIRQAVKDVAAEGLPVIQYANGHTDQLDVAMRRTVLTGVGQTVGELQIARADEMGQDLVAVSAHVGARNTGVGPANHESWQGQIYSRSDTHPKYRPFVETTGYGTGKGLHGYNCRHSFYPFIEGVSENVYRPEEYANKTVTYNGHEMTQYEASQRQRTIERAIRRAKREAGALQAAGLDNSAELARVRALQGRMRDFTQQTGLARQYERERVYVTKSGKDLNSNTISINLHSNHGDQLGISKDLRPYYDDGDSSKPYMREANTVLSAFGKQHILNEHPERLD